MKRFFKMIWLFLAVALAALACLGIFLTQSNLRNKVTPPSFWQVRSIDTMKYSRDVSGQALTDPNFASVINQQVSQIAATGANYVAIGTPYDDQFLPVLNEWVNAARRNHLHVWFRGNFSGWEGWFGYSKIDRAEHLQKTQQFILNHPDLFQDGDIFSACPECENGGPGDPRMTGDAEGHRKFLIDEYNITKAAFKKIHKNVASNYDSMNADVARLIMNPETTKALDGLVVIDHYVATPEQLASDIKNLAEQSGGKVALGEFGAPIPDINGTMTQEEQAAWIHNAFNKLMNLNVLVGVNYWTNIGSSTALWNDDGSPRLALQEVKKIYNPTVVKITVRNAIGQNINSTITSGDKSVSASSGRFSIIYMDTNPLITITAKGYKSKQMTVKDKDLLVILEKQNEDPIFKFEKKVSSLFNSR